MRPLWAVAAGGLASLVEFQPQAEDVVWSLIFQELQTSLAPEADMGSVTSSSSKHVVEMNVNVTVESEEFQEQEHSWRDPAAHALHKRVMTWVTDDNVGQTPLF